MSKATNTPPTGNVGEATIEETPKVQIPQEQPQQPSLTPEEEFDLLLKKHPHLAASIKKEEPKQEETKATPPPLAVTPTNGVKKENRIFILANNKKKGDVIIDLTDDVVFPYQVKDPVTGEMKTEKRTRRMRVVRGAQSIWQDEQTALPKEHIAKNQVTLTFSRGKCIIPVHETLKIQAALVSNRNTDNPNRVGHKDIYFYEWNPEAQAKKDDEKQNLIIQAMQIAATASKEDMLQHALYLAVPTVDEMGVPYSDQSIRTLYSKKAMNDPEKFLNSLQSPLVKTAYLVRRAINEGKIDLGKQPNQAYWTDGGFITALPFGRDSVEFLIEFASIQGEANQRFVSQLKELVTST